MIICKFFDFLMNFLFSAQKKFYFSGRAGPENLKDFSGRAGPGRAGTKFIKSGRAGPGDIGPCAALIQNGH